VVAHSFNCFSIVLQYELVTRRGVDVQIIELVTRLDRDAVKRLISSAIPQLSSVSTSEDENGA